MKNNRDSKREYKTFEQNEIKEEFTLILIYNENGHLITQKETNKKTGEEVYLLRREYTDFDEQNNWTKCIQFTSEKNNIPDKIILREYEYY